MPQRSLSGKPECLQAAQTVYHLVLWLSICYYLAMRKTRTTLPLEDKDREAIAAIRDYYGVTSDVDAIRIALRELHRRIQIDTPPKPQIRNGNSSPA